MKNPFLEALIKAGNEQGLFEDWLSSLDMSSGINDFIGFHEGDYDPDDYDSKKEYEEAMEENRNEKFEDYFQEKSQEFITEFGKISKIQNGGLKIFRCVTVADAKKYAADLKKGKYPKGFSGLGIFWSWDESAAECHWGDSKHPDTIVLEAVAPLNAVDFKTTVIKNLHTSMGDEKEIQLKEGAKIKLLSIEDESRETIEKFKSPLQLQAEKEPNKKEELKEKYGEKENTYLYFPVTINGEDEYHLTVKFLGVNSATKEEILEAMEGVDKSPPMEFQWQPIEWDSKNDGKVKVLELLGTPENLKGLHDSLEQFREDDYPEYRPHITVEDDLWEKIKRDSIQPGQALVQMGPLSIDIRGEKYYLAKDRSATATWVKASIEVTASYDTLIKKMEKILHDPHFDFKGRGLEYLHQELDEDANEDDDALKDDPIEKFEKIRADFKKYGKTKGGNLLLWRCVSVEDPKKFLDVLKRQEYLENFSGIGKHWSYTEKEAACIWAYGTHDYQVVLEAEVPVSSVDAENTLIVNLVTWGEREVRLVEGAPLKLLRYKVSKINEKTKKFEDFGKALPAEAAGWYAWESEPPYDHQPSELPLQNTGGPFMGAPGATFIKPEDEFNVKLDKDGANASVTAETYEDEGHVGDHWGTQASGIMFICDGKVLLLRRADWTMDPGLWGIAGGAVPVDKAGQPMNVKESAMNEVSEEMGVLPPHTDTGKSVVYESDDGFKYTTYLFEVPETFEPILNSEHERAQWFPLEELPEDIHPGVMWSLGKMGLVKATVESAKSDSCPLSYTLYRGIKDTSLTEIDPLFSGNGVFGQGTYYAFDPEISRGYAEDEIYGVILKYQAQFKSVLCLIEGKNIQGLPHPNDLVITDPAIGKKIGEDKYKGNHTIESTRIMTRITDAGYDAVSLQGYVDGGEQLIISTKAEPKLKLESFSVLTPDKWLAAKVSKASGKSSKEVPPIHHLIENIPPGKMKNVDPILIDYRDKYMEKINSSTKEEPMESFLPEDLVMLDGEFTNVNPKRDHLLQVAMLKLKLKDGQYMEVDEPLVLHMEYKGEPTSDFHKEHLAHIFEKCNDSNLQPGEAKQQICKWLGELKGKVQPTGDCVHKDMAFLSEKGLIDDSDIGADGTPIPGTFHYENFEMHPLKTLARHKQGAKKDVAGVDKENEHDALVDCRNQLLELNDAIKVLVPDVMAPERLTHMDPANPVNAEVKPQKSGVVYPRISWIQDVMNQFGFDFEILDAFIVGSVAKGKEHEGSDLDILMIVPKKLEDSIESLNDNLVNVLGDEIVWEGKKVDFQVATENDPDWQIWYDRIPLKSSIEGATKELPEPLRPNVRDDRTLRDSHEAQLKSFEGKALRADDFQAFQELLSTVLVKLELTEDYRKSVAGVLNQFRERKGYVAL